MGHLSIRDLQKISGEAIAALPGPTAIKSGARTVAILTPLKRPDPKVVEAALARVEELVARGPPIDDKVLIEMGVDPTNWSDEAVRALIASAP